MQRDTVHTGHRSTPLYPLRGDLRSVARTSLPGNPLAPSAARRFVRAALADWTNLGLLATCAFCRGSGGCPPGQHSTDRLADDAVLIVNELVTNAVVHAGTTVELLCRLEESAEGEPAALVIEVSDHHPARTVRSEPQGDAEHSGTPEYGRGLQLVGALAERWGITYLGALKAVWARLPVDGWDACPLPGAEPALQRGLRAAEILAPSPRRTVRDDQDWISRGALSFLAEASDLLAGQLDEDLVAALAGQLLVPRLADWCAIWLDGEAGRSGWGKGGGAGAASRLARVWHTDEARIEQLREVLDKEPPLLPDSPRNGPVPIPWPGEGEPGAGEGTALAYRLVAGGRGLGTLLVARHGLARVPDEVTALIEDFARRVALAISAARQYTRQATISRVLQRGLLPSKVGQIPGVDRFLIYEPSDDGVAGGDFYDIFPAAGTAGRWCFMLGDVQGSGPEAAVVTGLARPWLRLLAREGYQVGEVLDRLNGLLLDDAMEAAESAALMVAAAGGQGGQGVPEGQQARFLSLLYGELVPSPRAGGGVRCTLASAGHPLPLLLRPDGRVVTAAESQVLLGVVDDVAYQSQTFDLEPGDTLLCVTDGVTERRSGPRMFDDGDGLAQVLAGCAGLTAQGVAERIKQAVYEFAEAPPEDDLALLVLQAQ
ncbi:SpoIIE family protein phosphatase [Streptomyces sp. NBC_01142]|uniref:ATP-binding SpoIIE family protein phosphatase n=1 Tax=Streptomyces sp. NBC_01142 TaxID=2975865 RepID=UPI002256AFAC|nr:ATP-binding SpoIIE family protein phosphatase [Streptomyces sp. NBC_01142]MCX4823000.1 SpoIIE family protein phosphatase [Streptomyces sp. NBC_01142]